MSDKESNEEMDVKEDPEADQNKNKTQKRKKPAKASAPAKKKTKIEKKDEPKEDEEVKEESTVTETEGDSEEDEEPRKGLLDMSPEVTGTRVRKQVERLAVTAPALESPARKNEIVAGKGVKLGTSPKIVAQLSTVKHPDLVLMHRLFFKRPGSAHEIKKNIKEFSGFPFSRDEKEFESRKHLLEKNNMNDLKFICGILNLERSGTKEGVIERILEFCLCPNPSTKAVAPAKKAKKSKEGKKKTPSKSKEPKGSKSPLKSPTSKEIIEDDSSSSSSEDEGESVKEEEEQSKESAKTPAKAKKGDSTPAKGKKEASGQKKKTSGKKSPKKTEIKVKLPAVNKAKKKLAKESDDDKDTADTSKEEHSEAESGSGDTSPDVSPVKKAKKASPSKKDPTNEELVRTIKEILKDANLDNMTMKNLYKQVHEKYPNSELEKTRKDFIRSTAKEILGSGN